MKKPRVNKKGDGGTNDILALLAAMVKFVLNVAGIEEERDAARIKTFTKAAFNNGYEGEILRIDTPNGPAFYFNGRNSLGKEIYSLVAGVLATRVNGKPIYKVADMAHLAHLGNPVVVASVSPKKIRKPLKTALDKWKS